MNIVCLNISHKKAPIDVREKFSLTAIEQELFLTELRSQPWALEAFVLSTCNRTEVYVHVLNEQKAVHDILKMLFAVKKMQCKPHLMDYFCCYTGNTAIDHFFQVACGLDSLVIGEKQILGQVKSAVAMAREKGALSRNFNIMTNLAIEAGKKSQRETEISFGGSSISWAAVAIAEKRLGGISGRSFLIIGAGKMSKIFMKQIKDKNPGRVYVMNRSQDNARELAESVGGEAVSFCDMKEILSEVDICLCASGAPHYVIERNMVERIMSARKQKPMVLVDISVPRNIEPDVSSVENIQLYSVDDLDEVTELNMRRRQASIPQVKTIISAKISELFIKINKPTVRQEPALF